MPPDPRRHAGRLVTAVGAIALGCAIGAAVLAALGARHVSAGAAVVDGRTQALAAGRQIAVDFAAYDYRHLAQDFQRVSAESTGPFHSDFLTQTPALQEAIVKSKAVATAQVTSAGIVDASRARATVIVAIDRTVKNTTVPAGQTDSLGLEMTLVRTGGRWLASEVKPL